MSALRETLAELIPGATSQHLDRAVAEIESAAAAADRKAEADSVDGQGATVNPMPQVGDVWEGVRNGWRGRVSVVRDTYAVLTPARAIDAEKWEAWSMRNEKILAGEWRLVERDGLPWPPAKEPELGEDCGQTIEAERPEPDPHDYGANCWWPEGQTKEPDSQQLKAVSSVEPATDEQIKGYEWLVSPPNALELTGDAVRSVIARVRQEQDRVEQAERSEQKALDERVLAVARAERAEADAQRWEDTAQAAAAGQAVAEAEVARMRPVVEAAVAYRERYCPRNALTFWAAVGTYRAARKEADRG